MRKCAFILLILLFSAVQTYGADLETRVRQLEETILKQQRLIETQQVEINQLKTQAPPKNEMRPLAEKIDPPARPAALPPAGHLEPADRAYLMN
ncbi:MAG: hypothetical protein HY892_15775, partial [Deltaproteobacteria bacterium]|nr:hypothetical protein [Deltaproteobacteria bacterium]